MAAGFDTLGDQDVRAGWLGSLRLGYGADPANHDHVGGTQADDQLWGKIPKQTFNSPTPPSGCPVRRLAAAAGAEYAGRSREDRSEPIVKGCESQAGTVLFNSAGAAVSVG